MLVEEVEVATMACDRGSSSPECLLLGACVASAKFAVAAVSAVVAVVSQERLLLPAMIPSPRCPQPRSLHRCARAWKPCS